MQPVYGMLYEQNLHEMPDTSWRERVKYATF
jgi:hypothetical protein